jgi:enoyl-CoA hydratase
MSSALLVEEQADRVVLRLNRPEVRNAIDNAMVDELHRACDLLEQRPRVALVIGSGKTFAAGADIAQLLERRRDDALAGINSAIFARIQKLPMPTIALIDGFALGGGAELAYACDFRIGSPTTKIGNPEPGLGILAAAGATWRLRDLVGEPLAKEILLAGRVLTADEALAARLLNEVVSSEQLEAAGHRLTDRLCSQAPLSIRLAKSAFHAPAAAHPLIDNIAQAVLFETQDKHDRMTAFLERRKENR